MKNTLIIRIILISLTGLMIGLTANSQINMKQFSKEDLSDFDYKSQSSQAKLRAGDTSRLSIVLYANQTYRVLVASDSKLGAVNYSVIQQEKTVKHTIKEITKNTIHQEESEHDKYFNDDKNKKQESGDRVIIDTIWQTKFETKNLILFSNSSQKGKKNFWEGRFTKTKRLIIEVIVPKENLSANGVITILVGYKAESSSKFKTTTLK